MNFTDIGAFVGFCTGLFVLFERLATGRPLAFIVPGDDTGQDLRDLRCVNTSKSAIVITSIRVRGHSKIYLAKDRSLRGIAGSVLKMPVRKILEPAGQASFPIVIGDGTLLEDGAPSARFLFVIHWRKTSSIWLPQLPAFVGGTVRALKLADD